MLILALLLASCAWSAPSIDAASAERMAKMALACVGQEYPNKIGHHLNDDGDVKPPRLLTPAFFGCYDWHSAVHGHWLLARLARLHPGEPFAAEARKALAKSLSRRNMDGEALYLGAKGRSSFERPYGLAWLLQLAAELKEWDDPKAREWAAAIAPLEKTAARRLRDWLPKLTAPIRIGEHTQTAFAFGLVWDWAKTAGDREMTALLSERVRSLYGADVDCPLAYEPSGEDFLSPCLGEADLMRRVDPDGFPAWLAKFMPGIPKGASAGWLKPAIPLDPDDPRLGHLNGLNLSRAWMLQGVAAGLPEADARRPALLAAASAHRDAGLAALGSGHYMGGHWLGTYAAYLETGRGLR